MDEVIGGPFGFWSYVHRDNEQGGERILRLAERIKDEFSLITGEDLELFVDRDSLVWGDQWRMRVNLALQETTFFIPIVTPRYFTSDECRKELIKFITYARSLDATELLLPILYVNVADLTEENPDEAKAIIAATQYADWRELRLTDEDSEDYARAVNGLANRLADIAREYATRPSVVPTVVAEGEPGGDVDPDDEPGLQDLIAEMEPVLPEWNETMNDLAPIMVRISETTENATAEMSEADTFAKKVLAARRFASQLDGPATELLELGERYSSLLLKIDSGTRAVIALSGETDGEEEKAVACELFSSLRELIGVSRQSKTSIIELLSTMRGPARMFKDIRPPLKKMETGLRSIMDAVAVMDEWERLMDESPLDCST